MKRRFTKDEEEKIGIVAYHCELFLYGYNHSGSFLPREFWGREEQIAEKYNQFAGLHLIYTMFLGVDRAEHKKNQPLYGVCYRLLAQVGLTNLLEPITSILNKPLGSTTFKDYLRAARSNLATHGNLSFNGLDKKYQEITFKYEKDFGDLIHELAEEIANLNQKLNELLNIKTRVYVAHKVV